MKKFKNQKGITLVALVVTIIVLIILAGVSISLIMRQDGIVRRATEGRDKYANAAAYENEQLANVDAFALTIGESSTPTNFAAYTVGQEVRVGEESFYVLETSNSSQSSVVLLAKYNLNQAGTAQVQSNVPYAGYGVRFSNTNYWQSKQSTYTNWNVEKLDLNKETIPTTGTNAETLSNNALLKAKNYATTKGGRDGRLLTYEEVEILKDDYEDMIYGASSVSTDGKGMRYWLSSAVENESGKIWFVLGHNGFSFSYGWWDSTDKGVRPVITVDKSLVTEL